MTSGWFTNASDEVKAGAGAESALLCAIDETVSVKADCSVAG